MKTLPPMCWVAWIGGSLLCVLLVVSCGKSDPPAVVATAPVRAGTMDESLLMGETRLVPLKDGSAYLTTMDGVWLLNGTKAERVKEVTQPPSTSPSR